MITYDDWQDINMDIHQRLEIEQDINKNLIAKVQHLVNLLDYNGQLKEGCYTFPDGDAWYADRSNG